MRASQKLLQSRIAEVEECLIQGMSPAQIISQFQTSSPKCLLCPSQEQPCSHGLQRWSDEKGKPVCAETIKWYIKKARASFVYRYQAISEKRRALLLARLERAYQLAYQDKDIPQMLQACRMLSQLSGCIHLVEKQKEATLFERVQRLLCSLEDEDLHPKRSYPKPPKISQLEARMLLAQLERFLLKAENSVAAFQKEPKPKDEAGTRLYLRNQLVEAVHQALTTPGLAPEARREALQKLSASYGLLTRDVDLAERIKHLEELLPSF